MSIDLTMNQFVIFMLVLTRVSAMIIAAPMFGSQNLPMRVRAIIAIGLSLLVAPVFAHIDLPSPENLIALSLLISSEAVVGLALGFGINILFQGVQLAGQIIGQMSGMQLADVFNPTVGSSIPLFSQLLDTVMLAVFVTIGGHHQLIGALLDSFRGMPPGAAHFSESFMQLLISISAQSFHLGLRIGAPIMVALLMSILILGLISRTLPQLNVLQIGFSFNSMAMIFMLALTIGAGATLFSEHVYSTIEAFQSIFNPIDS